MTDWYCKDCPVTGTDCGPWDDQHETFSSIRQAHKNCLGFQKGEPKLRGRANWGYTEIEKEATDFLLSHWDEWLHILIANVKGPDKVCLIKDKWRWMNQK